MVQVLVALGGNLGDVPDQFRHALNVLSDGPDLQVCQVSGIYRTAPVGAAAGNAYYNAAISCDTILTAECLLDRLQDAELRAGRTREIHWGPRTLDLDLIAYGDSLIQTSRLTVPHPAAWYRRFVLDPVCEFAGDTPHPQFDVTWQALRRRLLARPLPVTISGGTSETRAQVALTLSGEFPVARLYPQASTGGMHIWLGAADEESSTPPDLAVDGSRWGADTLAQARFVLMSTLDSPERIGDWSVAV